MANRLYVIQSNGTLRRLRDDPPRRVLLNGLFLVPTETSLATGLTSITGMAATNDTLYIQAGGLYRVDFTNGDPSGVTRVGNRSFSGAVDLTSTGTSLFATNGSGTLYSISTTTGAGVRRGGGGLSNVVGIGSVGSTLYLLRSGTGRRSGIVPLVRSSSGYSVGSHIGANVGTNRRLLARAPSGASMYTVRRWVNNRAFDGLARVDITNRGITASVTAIGDIPLGVGSLVAMAYFDPPIPPTGLVATIAHAADYKAAPTVKHSNVDLEATVPHATGYAATPSVVHPVAVSLAAALTVASGYTAALTVVHPPDASLAATIPHATGYGATLDVTHPTPVDLTATIPHAAGYGATLDVTHPPTVELEVTIDHATGYGAVVDIEHPTPVNIAATVPHAADYKATLDVTHPTPVDLTATIPHAAGYGAALDVTHPPTVELEVTIDHAAGYGVVVHVGTPLGLEATIDHAADYSATLDVDHPVSTDLAATLESTADYAAVVKVTHPPDVTLAATLDHATGYAATLDVTHPEPVNIAATIDHSAGYAATLDIEHPTPVNIAATVSHATEYGATFTIEHAIGPGLYTTLGNDVWTINPDNIAASALHSRLGPFTRSSGIASTTTGSLIDLVGLVNDGRVYAFVSNSEDRRYQAELWLVNPRNPRDTTFVGLIPRSDRNPSTDTGSGRAWRNIGSPNDRTAFKDDLYFLAGRVLWRLVLRFPHFISNGVFRVFAADNLGPLPSDFPVVNVRGSLFTHDDNMYAATQGELWRIDFNSSGRLSGATMVGTLPATMTADLSELHVSPYRALGSNVPRVVAHVRKRNVSEIWELNVASPAMSQLFGTVPTGLTSLRAVRNLFFMPELDVGLSATIDHAAGYAATLDIEHPTPVNIAATIDHGADYGATPDVAHPEPVNIAATIDHGADYGATVEVTAVPPTRFGVRVPHATEYGAAPTVTHPEPVNIAATIDHATDYSATLEVRHGADFVQLAANIPHATEYTADLVVVRFPKAPLNFLSIRAPRLVITIKDE